MRTSYPCCFAARKMRSMFSTVLFSVTLCPTEPHAAPVSLRTSFCGSMNTTAVSFRSNRMISSRSSGLQELEEVCVDAVLEGRAHAVRRALVDLEPRVLDELRRLHGRRSDRNDLVVVAMQDERRNVDLREIGGLIRFGEGLDAEV